MLMERIQGLTTVVGVMSWQGVLWGRRKLLDFYEWAAKYYHYWQKFAVILLIVTTISCLAMLVSAVTFGTMYFSFLPTVYHSIPLDFQYKRSCIEEHRLLQKGHQSGVSGHKGKLPYAYTESCFPIASFDLKTPEMQSSLQEGISYSVVIKLELPETTSNMDMGMFMVKMDVCGSSGDVIHPDSGQEKHWKHKKHERENRAGVEKHITASRPLSMRHRSGFIRTIRTLVLWPLLLFELLEESQHLDSILFTSLYLDQAGLNWTARVTVDSPAVQIHSARLDITAHFSGAQWLVYRWPALTFLFGTSAFFLPSLVAVVLAIYFLVYRPWFAHRAPAPPSSVGSRRTEARAGGGQRRRASNRSDDAATNTALQNLMMLGRRVSDDTNPAAALSLPDSSSSRRSSASSSSIEMIGSSHLAPSTASADPQVDFPASDGVGSDAANVASEETELRKRKIL